MGGGDNGCGSRLLGVTFNKHSPFGLMLLHVSWGNVTVVYSDPCTILRYLITCSFSNYFMLYIHTGSPSVTSLIYNNRSRILTCTSTGGPATTVTWRRNGVVITLGATHQQTKNLVDSVNGIYQAVLTIDSSVRPSDLVGNYNCTVQNIRGTSSMSVFVGETIITPCHYCWSPFLYSWFWVCANFLLTDIMCMNSQFPVSLWVAWEPG